MHAVRACRPCTTARRPQLVVARRAAGQRPRPRAHAIANRWNGDASGCTGRCGGTCEGTTSTSSRGRTRRARRPPRRDGRSGSGRACRRGCRCAFTVIDSACRDRAGSRRRARRSRVPPASSTPLRAAAAARRRSPPTQGRAERRRAANAARSRSSRAGSSSASILFAATTTGLSCSRSPVASRPGNSASSRVITVEVLDRIAPVDRRHVDDVHQHARALEMAEEAMAEPVPLVRPFDQSRHVGDDERAIARQADDAEVGRQRRERIVGDLGLRRGDARDDRRLAGVRDSRRARRPPAASAAAADPSLRRAVPAACAAARGWSTSRSARCPGRRDRPSR